MPRSRSALFALFLLCCIAAPARAGDVFITESTQCVNIFADQDVTNLLDSDVQTCWAECGEGDGLGEWVRFEFEGPVVLERLGVANGCQREGAFEEYNRVKTLRVTYDNGFSEAITLADEPGTQYLPLTPTASASLTIQIEDIYLAANVFDRGKTCLSEVIFVGTLLYEEGAQIGDQEAEREVSVAETPAEESVETAPEEVAPAEPVEEATAEEPAPEAVTEEAAEPAASDEDGVLALPEGAVRAQYRTLASSSLESQLGGQEFSAANLVDGSKRTAWVEGAPGAGLGEWAEIDLPVAQPVSGLWIANGCQSGEQTFTANNRAKVLEVCLNSGPVANIELEDIQDMQFVDLGEVTTDMIRLTLVDVYQGGDGEHTCLAEVRPAFMAGEQAVSAAEEAPQGSPEEQALATVRDYFVKLFTLDDGYAQLFARDIRDGEELTYEVFRELQKQRGLYKVFRKALVDLDTLEMTVEHLSETEAKVRTQGVYTVYIASTYEQVQDDSVFTLIFEDGRWRILDKQEL